MEERKDVEIIAPVANMFNSWVNEPAASFYMKCRNNDCYRAVALVMDQERGACGFCVRCGTVTYPGQTRMARTRVEIEGGEAYDSTRSRGDSPIESGGGAQ